MRRLLLPALDVQQVFDESNAGSAAQVIKCRHERQQAIWLGITSRIR
jgi:hypothetical protein